MNTKFKIIRKFGSDNWEPHNGVVQMSTLLNINHGGKDLLFEVKVDNKHIEVLCDPRTMISVPENKEGFINKKFKGTCWLKNDILNQRKVDVSFGDYPNGNSILAITENNGGKYFSDTSHYYMTIISQ